MRFCLGTINGILPANRYRLVGKENPQMVPSVEPVPIAGQIHQEE